MRRHQRDGLTIIEVIVALLILTLGVLGAFALQASALQGTRAAITSQGLATAARTEILLQSQFRRTIATPIVGESCRTPGQSSLYTCSIAVYPCTGSATTVTCTNSNVTGLVAHQVRVTVTAADGRSVNLSTVVKAP
jgi:type IV pilus assembly protein PilV